MSITTLTSHYYRTYRNIRTIGIQIRTMTKLTSKDLNKQVLDAEYAVRGRIPKRAEELQELLDNGEALPFKEIIQANIGNPQQLDQKPLTWYRQVLSILQYPKILESQEAKNIYPEDVISRANKLLENIGSVGAYSNSQGVTYIRKSVANYISERDGFPADPNNIFLTGGASAAVQYILQAFSSDNKSGFLIPIPQYPLYTATITLNNAVAVPYFLNEEQNWATDSNEIEDLIISHQSEGITIKALVVINPGNPTGAILSENDIEDLINIAADYSIVLIADEVYQKNIFQGEFISMKKVLCKLLEKDPKRYENVQLVSLHSTSKGVSGECGQRGGYMELVGFNPEVKDNIFKLACINLCSSVTGQALVELMTNTPRQGSASYDVYEKETTQIGMNLESRAGLLYNAFETMTDVTCNKPMGAMYLFPKLNFTTDKYAKLFAKASAENLEVDEFYALKLLENTGICCVPGSGFGQKPDTYHLRTTFLAPGTEWIEQWKNFHTKFVAEYKK